VVVRRRNPVRSRTAGGDQRLHPGDRLLVGRIGRDDHPRPVREQAGVRRPIAARLAPGERMPADEPQARSQGALDDPGLRARHVRHDGVGTERDAPTPQLVDELEAGERRRGEHDEVGLLDGLGHAGGGTDPVGLGGPRPGPTRRPGPDVRPGRERGPRHGPADQPETEHRDAHAPSMSARPPLVSSGATSGLRQPGPAGPSVVEGDVTASRLTIPGTGAAAGSR